MGTCRAVTCYGAGSWGNSYSYRLHVHVYIYVSYDQGDVAHLPENSNQLRLRLHGNLLSQNVNAYLYGHAWRVELRIYDWYDTIRYDPYRSSPLVPVCLSACRGLLLLPSTLLERLANQFPLYIYIYIYIIPLIRLLCGLPKLARLYIYMCAVCVHVCVLVGNTIGSAYRIPPSEAQTK